MVLLTLLLKIKCGRWKKGVLEKLVICVQKEDIMDISN